MTWEDELFALLDDLEGQAEALYDAEREADLADRSRAEYQQVALAGRLMATVGSPVSLDVLGVGLVEGELDRVSAEWCLVSGAGQDWVVRIAAIGAVHGASGRAVPEVAWSPLTRLGLGAALRRIADAGTRCVAHRLDGQRYDGEVRRVGADFVELVDAGERVALVAFGSLAAVQRRD